MPKRTTAPPARQDVVRFAEQFSHELAHAGTRSNLDDVDAMLVAERARDLTSAVLHYTIAHLVDGSLGASCSPASAVDFFAAEWLRRAAEGVRSSARQDIFLSLCKDALREAKAFYVSSSAMWWLRVASTPMAAELAEVAQ